MDNVLLSSEVDIYIQTMTPQSMGNLGTMPWLEFHQRLQKLNQQAVVEACCVKEEYVKEALTTFGKIPVLVHEVILINLWKHKVFPYLLKLDPEPQGTFLAYSVLYHEAVCVSLLELAMFHGGTAEALEDSAHDLEDYACGAVAQLLTINGGEREEKRELMRQRDELCFDIGIRCLGIVRYLAEHLDRLPLGVTAAMYDNDVPGLLVEIVLTQPWIKADIQYSKGRWVPRDHEAVTPAAAQVWLTLRQLLLDPNLANHYEITQSRRSQLMKLQPLLTPVLIDQISPLAELSHWLCMLAAGQQLRRVQRPVLLEIVPQIKSKMLEEYGGKWRKIAREQLPVVFSRDKQKLHETAQMLNEAFNADFLEKFEESGAKNKCAGCDRPAIQRCSRCKKDWYCSRRCQVEQWAQHKIKCEQV